MAGTVTASGFLLLGGISLTVQVATASQVPSPERTEEADCLAVPAPGGADRESLTGKLDDCDSVLKPPMAGDGAFVQPAPDEGRTPVIEPEELPRTPSVPDVGD